jgi:hypothetical protein
MGKKNSFLGIKSSGRNPLVANGLILIGLALISHIGILALDGYSTAYAANGTFLPDQVNDVTDGTSFGCGFPPIALGSIFQSFTPSVSTLAAVDVRLRAGGDFPMLGYDTTIKIRAGTYDGQEVGTATTFVSGPQIGGTELLVRFLFSPSICLIPGDTYVIEWISPEGGGVILTWMGATSNSYENGSFFGCQGLPPTGEEWDLYFITYTLASDVILDQHQSVIDNTLGGLAIGGSSEQILAQVVTAAVTGFLTEVRFPVVCTGGDLTVQIQGVKEGEDSQNLGLYIPNGVILASETISGTSLPTFSPNPPSFRNLPFSRPPTISAGDRFAIVLSSNANDGCAVFQGPDGNPYSEGEAFFDARPNTPGVWLPITIGSNKHDLPFQTIIGIPIDDDTDCDGIPDDVDNCLDDPNADQLDTDRDKIGDVCDDDDDNDTILDANDNCPLVFNFDQANKDGDNYGDACDNCPDIINNDQTDSDGDGLGNACEEFAEDLDVPPASTTFRPGAPLWVTATFTNSTTQSIQTIRPDCFNTTFTVTNPAGIILDPRYRIRQAYGIPTDLVFIPGQFSVTCNLAEMFDQRILTSGPGGNPVSYDLVATYSNDHLDPDIVNGVCTDPTNECYNLIWTGEVSSDRQSVTIAGSPVTTATANVVFAPNVWQYRRP